jgi:hypothetical protein
MKDKTTFSYIKNYCGQRNPVHWYSADITQRKLLEGSQRSEREK